MSGLFLRDAPDQTLDDLYAFLDQPSDIVEVAASSIEYQQYGEGEGTDDVLVLGSRKRIQATSDSLLSLVGYLQIPMPFWKRLERDEKKWILNSRLQYTPGTVVAKLVNDYLSEVRNPGQTVIEPRRLVDIARRTMKDGSAAVVEAHDGDFFGFDVITQTDFTDLGKPEVGDITKGGLRFEQDRKHNLVPSVQPYTYTLVCTNGMECYDEGLKVDARGSTLEDVLLDLELAAQRAFGSVEEHIRSLYDLRNQRVQNPERTLRTRAQEAGISNSIVMRMLERLPALVDDDGQATMFDVVNLATNQANQPGLNLAARRNLERFGGQVVSDHTARCAHCQQRTTH